jgi:RNA polymerase sigma factor (sigma-70 family)
VEWEVEDKSRIMNTEPITCETNEMAKASNEFLLGLMAGKTEGLAEQAFAEFYQRHRSYIYHVACKVADGILDDGEKLDLVQDTFIRAFERASTFHGHDLVDEVQERRWARAWLGKIANNIMIDKLRKKRGVLLLNYDDDNVRWEVEQIKLLAPIPKSPKLRLLQEALEQLTPKEQMILRLAALNFIPGDEQLRIPRADLNDLARTYNVSKGTIRQIKRRAIEKIRKYVAEKR